MGQIFKTGDVVVLKSGGPQMTVEKYKFELVDMYSSRISDHIVWCTWFDNESKLVRHEFEQESLMKYEK